MRSGRDRRGNTADRRARKAWLLSVYGDGTTCPCYWCGKRLTADTCTADRIQPGGPYRRTNLAPACMKCNTTRGSMSFGEARKRLNSSYEPIRELSDVGDQVWVKEVINLERFHANSANLQLVPD